ncbi:E3 ubiquitin-protein ligase MSL2 [Agrilus planipennis]|uniref:E3 ubiquitin-protein ligase MSL2 n=1 Tax=Agrilus planipennis TaxID=224129 RepID=A0A1W4XSR9_AGRPL|nr:E3 ubiquitin-protein ligase MSL2 [Agrilus planipennis]
MNPFNLYVTTSQIILKSTPESSNTWQDLYRLVPYLRNSLCCVVCGNLLLEPLTPSGKCQHHVCRKCKGGRKKLKPTCTTCKDYKTYSENKPLRTLLQCYNGMCVMLISSEIFRILTEQAAQNVPGAANLILLIKEGAVFEDNYHRDVGLSKSAYSILPCIYTNSGTQTLQINNSNSLQNDIILDSDLRRICNGNLYSVLYSGTGSKITIKRKPLENQGIKGMRTNINDDITVDKQAAFKKPTNKCMLKSRRGCRCGNATATPGKLTCCGQRCPCYVESKACIECKCRGCRNPHMPDGNKKRPQLIQDQQVVEQHSQSQSNYKSITFDLDTNMTVRQLSEHLKAGNVKVFNSFAPHAILIDGTKLVEEDEDEEVMVDI